MKGTIKLCCGILFVLCVMCSSIAVAYAMGNAEGTEVIHTGRAMMCTIIALSVVVLAVLKRHVWKR